MADGVVYRCDEMVKSFSVTYVPGGATQNTIRIAQVVVITITIVIITIAIIYYG